jgi:amidophosphoribosyltransferase
MRDFGVRTKLNPVRDTIRGRKVVIMEDSIIRGTTSRTRIKAIRDAGAKEISMIVSCPPTRYPCFYGIDFSTKGELIAAKQSVEEIRKFLDLDALHYLSLEAMVEASGANSDRFCMACFNGRYPTKINEHVGKFSLEE